MLFDDLVSQVFDEVIDWVERLDTEIPFLESLFKEYKVQKVLDVGCSTGNHAIALGRKGFDVSGIDFSTYSIQKARQTLSESYLPEGVSVKFYQDDFSVYADLTQIQYDAIMVLGNTLSLANSTESVKEILTNIHQILADKGVVIVQVLNFDNTDDNTHFVRLKEMEWKGDPCIVQQGYFIHHGIGTYLFVALRKRNNEKWDYWIKENATIYPFTYDRMEKIAKSVGFKIKHAYSGFDKSKFKQKSEQMIVVLEKT